ncbi:restriction endonuclease [Corallococcus exiguus]|uniref:restriction endonuclease n=1 Tax=Corallococcus exiguus TaxID=83462 RepID=UPI0034579A09
MSAETFEYLVCDWVYSLGQYARIEKLAGSGDSWLDVVGFESPTDEDPWVCFQCKRYGLGVIRSRGQVDYTAALSSSAGAA